MHADAWLRKAIRAIIKINAGPKARLFRAAEARLKAKGEELGKESLPYMQMRSGTELLHAIQELWRPRQLEEGEGPRDAHQGQGVPRDRPE